MICDLSLLASVTRTRWFKKKLWEQGRLRPESVPVLLLSKDLAGKIPVYGRVREEENVGASPRQVRWRQERQSLLRRRHRAEPGALREFWYRDELNFRWRLWFLVLMEAGGFWFWHVVCRWRWLFFTSYLIELWIHSGFPLEFPINNGFLQLAM